MLSAPPGVPRLGWVLALSMLLIGGNVSASTPIKIAVAPFVGDSIDASVDAVSIAQALAARLSRRDLERLIPPGDSIAQALFEPRAAEIRRWAYSSAVDTIVVGRVSLERKGVANAPFVIETILRSGHSGAEMGRHEVVVPRQEDLDASLEILALEILKALGHQETPAGQGEKANSESDSSAGALDVAFSKSNFKSDAPIEIKADEAEIINRDEGRKLIFQRNVWVRQDNVTLRSDRLEATYRKGESEPRELIAEGHVRIVQNDRRAKCDRAIYLREENRLICSGRAELIQGCDRIRGDSIEFDLAGERARVAGAASIVIQSKKDASGACAMNRGPL